MLISNSSQSYTIVGHQLTFLLVLFLSVISSMMQMMYSGMMPGDRRYQRMIAQRRMRMMRVMMAEESDRRGSSLMLGLHALLYLALHLSQNRMMRRPSCQMEREHRRRSLKQPGRGQQGSTRSAGAAAGRQRKGQTASRLQDHLRYQLAGCCLSFERERSVRLHQSSRIRPDHQERKRSRPITSAPESCVYQKGRRGIARSDA